MTILLTTSQSRYFRVHDYLNIHFVWFVCLFLAVLWPASAFCAKEQIIFGGGLNGGTFHVMAKGVEMHQPVKALYKYDITARISSGSMENLRKTDTGEHHMSVVNSSHVWLGRNGQLKNDPKKYKNVMAVAWLYGVPAQLAVRKGLRIRQVNDLAGKRVAVGKPGSGDLDNSERYFRNLGIWNRTDRISIGYNVASAALIKKQLDAIWLFTPFPSGAVIMAAQDKRVDLVDLDRAARASGYYEKFPFFSKTTIPSGTYRGINHDVSTYQDSVLWVANKKVPDALVHKLLSIVYSDVGIRRMHSLKRTFKHMDLDTGTANIVTPLHPGAKKFWREKTGYAAK